MGWSCALVGVGFVAVLVLLVTRVVKDFLVTGKNAYAAYAAADAAAHAAYAAYAAADAAAHAAYAAYAAADAAAHAAYAAYAAARRGGSRGLRGLRGG